MRRCALLVSMAKNRTKGKDLAFDIDKEFIYSLWREQDGCCLLTGKPFALVSGVGVVPYAPSLDRIEPALGYTKGNVRLISYHLNVAISEFGLEGFESLLKDYVSYQKQIGDIL